MSTSVWPFTIKRPYSERRTYLTNQRGLTGGFTARRAEYGDDGKFTARFAMRLPRDSQTLATWYSFVDARKGADDSFLYKSVFDQYHDVTDEAVGTGDGSTTDFALDMKHIDTSTLVVELDGTPTVLYTLTGNNSAPIIEFNSAPAGSVVITASYDYYHQVHFDTDDLEPEILARGSTDATTLAELPFVSVTETQPGDYLA